MKKIINNDIFRDAVEEIYPEEKIDKTAFDINMAASTLLGYSAGNIAGKAIGKNKAKNKIMRDNLRESGIPNLDGDYYSQVENISKNLKVIFTPLSAVYVIKSRGKDITIDVVDKAEMNESMLSAFKEKDSNFFRNIMLNKIVLDVQNVEQLFAKKLIDANNELVGFNKKASESDSDIYDEIKHIYTIQRFVKNNPESPMTDYFSKVAEEINMTVNLEIERPIANYSSLGDSELSMFKLARTTKEDVMQEKMLNRKYINKHVKVGFMADRVTFSVDDIVISQLHSMAMNEEGYTKFRDKDYKYFKALFMKEVDDSELIKTASEVIAIKDVFYNSLVHPKIYYILFNSRFGNEWLDYDPEVLTKVVETEFELTEAICDRALDKILSIQNVCKSTDCLVSPFIFEKIARAFNSKPITFNEWEYNLSPGELINALQIMDELTPNNDIFDDLSEKVTAYISKAFVLGECRAIVPNDNIISSELESRFFEILNSDINQRWSSLNTQEIAYQRYIQPLASAVIKGVRASKDYKTNTIDGLLSRLSSKSKITDERVLNLSRQTAITNLAIDIMLEEVEGELVKLRNTLNI